MILRFSPEAEADLLATLDFIREHNAAAAVKLAKRVFSTLTKLAAGKVDGPEFRLASGELVRSWLIPPFRVFYQRRAGEFRVLRVYHHARRPITTQRK